MRLAGNLLKSPAITTMNVSIPLYNGILKVVKFFSNKLNLSKYENKIGRKTKLKIQEVISLAIYKNSGGANTKKFLWKTFNLKKLCTYKTLVVSLNRTAPIAMKILFLIMRMNKNDQHLIKHIDSSEIPVCLFKNAHSHKTMKEFASFSRGAKGTYFGLKIHLISDVKRKILAVRITTANVNDREYVIPLAEGLEGIFIADAGYISKKLQKEFYQEGKRILLIKPRKSMRKIMTKFQEKLYQTRMIIELSFRNLKMFYGLVTSLPRSISGYFANYVYALLSCTMSGF